MNDWYPQYVEILKERDALLLQIETLTKQAKVDVRVMGEISDARDVAFRLKDDALRQLGRLCEKLQERECGCWATARAILQETEKRKCDMAMPGPYAPGYGYPLRCGLEAGHQPPHRCTTMNAEWD